MRIQAWHPASGNTLTGEVTDVTGDAPRRSFLVIPDGLLESVILREGTWVVRVDDRTGAAGAMRRLADALGNAGNNR